MGERRKQPEGPLLEHRGWCCMRWIEWWRDSNSAVVVARINISAAPKPKLTAT